MSRTSLDSSISAAVDAGRLLPAAADNLRAFLSAGLPAWAEAAIAELVNAGAWGELNDRFYRFLEFGTGGMRGRTIGVTATAAERGESSGPEVKELHAKIGQLAMENDFLAIALGRMDGSSAKK